MINKTIARRYAQAFFEIGQEQNAVEKFAHDIKYVVQSFEASEELKKIMYSRLVSSSAKKDLFNKLVENDISPMAANFVNLVLDKSREEYLPAIAEVFDELVDLEKKILSAKVKAASALSNEQVGKLEEKLSQITGQKVKVSVETDPSLIGGLSVKIGDVVYDGSIAKQLGILKEHLQQVHLGR